MELLIAHGDFLIAKISKLLNSILAESTKIGSMSFDEMFRYASEQKFDGIAVAKGDDREYYLAFRAGEPEGAIYIDEQGAFYGDSAAMLIPENQIFCLHKIKAEIVSPIIMGCRLFEKPFIRTRAVNLIPMIGTQSAGIGVLNLVVMRGNSPVNGVRVSIRKDGMIVGSDITTGDGAAGFRLMYGHYKCIVEISHQRMKLFDIRFDKEHDHIVLDIQE